MLSVNDYKVALAKPAKMFASAPFARPPVDARVGGILAGAAFLP